jgi:hypothetical protein
VTRIQLIERTQALIDDGDALATDPSLTVLQEWIARTDRLLSEAWGTMDRWHLAWLMVGRPEGAPRGRTMSPDEEATYVRSVAAAKTSVLRASLDAADRQRMPFLGETQG